MNLFHAAVARVLEVDSLDRETDFRSLDGWCSLKAFGLLVMLENDWGAPLDIGRFLELETVRDLEREAFLVLASRIFGVSRGKLNGTTRFGEIPEWDSVNHLRLVMETEAKFGERFDLERIPLLAALDDFLV